MGPEIIIIIAFILFMGGLFAGVFAVMKKGRGPVLETYATVIRTYVDERYVNQNGSSQSVVETSSNLVKTYRVEFKIKDGKRVKLILKKKIWLNLHDGDYGKLTYQNQKMLSFEPKQKSEVVDDTLTFRKKKEGPTCLIYGEASDSGFSLQTEEKEKVDLKDIEKLIKRIKNDDTDWFFVLSKENGDDFQVERAPDDEVKITQSISGMEEETILSMSKLIEKITEFINK